MPDMTASPASSPRLPSPPPIAEDQIGPTSPTPVSRDQGKLELALGDQKQNASRRIRPGTKSADMPEGPPLMDLVDIDTPFQLTEHLKALYNAAIHRRDSETITPIDRETAIQLAQPPDGVDRALWLYELCRFLCQKVNLIITALFADIPPCSAQTCTEMRASEWQYLCAVHDPPKACCAIDYCCHTLDWAANVLTSPKHFPSRLTLGAEDKASHSQLRQLTNIFRRVYRIFAHAWFQHQEAFWRVESTTGLYIFFKTVCDLYGLIPEDSYTIPPVAEGVEVAEVKVTSTDLGQLREERPALNQQVVTATEGSSESSTLSNTAVASGHTTKRHRQMPSTGAVPVSTVIEENEDEEKDASAQRSSTSITESKTSPIGVGAVLSDSEPAPGPGEDKGEQPPSSAAISGAARGENVTSSAPEELPREEVEITKQYGNAQQAPFSNSADPTPRSNEIVSPDEPETSVQNERSQETNLHEVNSNDVITEMVPTLDAKAADNSLDQSARE